MKETLSTWQAADRLRADQNAGWSYAGARALVEYLEQIEEDTGEEMELDVVAIRCAFSEYSSASEAAAEYSGFAPEAGADEEEDALTWLREQTQVIEIPGGGVIIEQF